VTAAADDAPQAIRCSALCRALHREQQNFLKCAIEKSAPPLNASANKEVCRTTRRKCFRRVVFVRNYVLRNKTGAFWEKLLRIKYGWTIYSYNDAAIFFNTCGCLRYPHLHSVTMHSGRPYKSPRNIHRRKNHQIPANVFSFGNPILRPLSMAIKK
jgi:hypothetical protein